MIPEVGQHIKVILKNNTVVEGIVEEWFNNYVKLKSLDEKSILIIPHPNEDIMLIKVFLTPEFPKLEFVKLKKDDGTEIETTPEAHRVLNEVASLEEQFQETLKLPSDNPDRLKTLAELKRLMNEQEKKIVSEKVKNHYIDGTRKVQYGYPGFFKKPRTK